ncbi:alpha/beta fold hydrolase [Kitasatospora sp. NPDC059327]|uniref:alpha/beta fold hydrolase n=1 Tax=Kitasatospora sp. NPDC059327 TaxID=3346803 RepID=UPI003685D224
MPFLTVGEENAAPVRLYYEDHGTGRPVVLVPAWPLNAASWESQEAALLAAGHRVVSYDRRGFGRSDRPWDGYDLDTLATDLHTLVTALDLRDATLVGYSLGGGEVTRYLAVHGSGRVRSAVLIAAAPPYPCGAHDRPGSGALSALRETVVTDRAAFMTGYLHDLYAVDLLRGAGVSERVAAYHRGVGLESSARATTACADAWGTDLRPDLPRIDVPVLVLHGAADRTLPPGVTAEPLAALLADATLRIVPGAPHGLIFTHAEEVNSELAAFLA